MVSWRAAPISWVAAPLIRGGVYQLRQSSYQLRAKGYHLLAVAAPLGQKQTRDSISEIGVVPTRWRAAFIRSMTACIS